MSFLSHQEVQQGHRPTYPQVFLFTAALNPFVPQPVLIQRIAPTQLQDPALGLIEHHEVHMGPLSTSWDCPGPSGWRPISQEFLNHTTHVGVICKVAEDDLSPTVYVIEGDIKLSWSQYGPLRVTTCHRSPSGHWAFDQYPLDVTIHTIPHSQNSPLI